MGDFISVCQTADVPEGEIRAFKVGGQAIAIYNVMGAFHATEDRCTHGLAALSEGLLDGDLVECPLHFGAFNVKTGAPAAPPCSIPIKIFVVRVEEGNLLVEVT